jgi:hypothetical protein
MPHIITTKEKQVRTTEHNAKQSSAETGLLAVLANWFHDRGRGASAPVSSGGSGGRGAWHCVVVGCALVALGLSAAAPALAAEPPVFLFSGRAIELHPTRAIIESGSAVPSPGEETYISEDRLEYATSESGPFTVAKREVLQSFQASSSLFASVEHLAPGTTYYVRFFVETASGASATEKFQFTTPPPSAPEVANLEVREHEGRQLGTTFAQLEAAIEGNGAETTYSFEYATSKEGPWSPFTSGATGKVSVAEDSATPVASVTGLAPESTYYVRITAENADGHTSATTSFETEPAHPTNLSLREREFSDVTATSVLLRAEFRSHGSEAQWHFEYATSEGGPWTTGPGGTLTAAEATAAGEGESKVGPAELTGLSPGTTYYIRCFVDNGHPPAQTSNAISFKTAGPPAATTFVTHAIEGEEMRALGVVESGFEPGDGYDGHYHVEYVGQAQFEASGWAEAASTPEVDDAGGGGIVGADLPGLKTGETYHYRFVSSNTTPGDPVVEGNEETLSVPAPAPAEAPTACPNEAFRAGPSARLPDCRAYEQVTPVEKGATQDEFRYGGFAFEGTLLGADGESVFLHDPGVKWGSSPDSVQGNYFFSRTPSGWQTTSTNPAGEVGTGGADSLRPLVFNPDLTQIGISAQWNDSVVALSADIEFKVGSPGGPYQLVASIPRTEASEEGVLVGESADGSKFVLETEDRTLAGHATGTTSGDDLYEFSEGQLHQLNVLGGSPGTPISACGAQFPTGVEGGGHTVSSDGSRVFFTDNCTHHLYMRVDSAETVDLGEYNFIAADAEGSKLLVEKQNGQSYEVFLYETATRTAKRLFSTGESAVNRDENATFLVSEDFSTIYFSSKERLTAEAPPVVGSTDKVFDVYRYDIAAEALRFVVQGSAPRYVSPDGGYFYFDWWGTHDVSSVTGLPAPPGQVYRYDSAENVVQCMSCASPFDPSPRFNAVFVSPEQVTDQNGVPSRTVASANGDFVFFDTPSALLPQDVDGEREPEGGQHGELKSDGYSPSSDVYEWRKDGVDGCSRIQGCLALITTGKGGFLNKFLGTDASGRDVFFATNESLVLQDDDTASDIYDARIGGGFPPPAARPVECEGDACSTPAAAPNDLTPSSATFQGAGDLAAGALPEAKPKPKKKTRKHAGAKRRGRKSARAKRSVHDSHGGAK